MTRSMSRFEARVQEAQTPGHPSRADVARDNITGRNNLCRDLDRICPDAVDLASEAIGALHERINGRSAALCGNRTANDFRDILRGVDPITGEDLARLAIQAPADLVAWLAPILAAVAHGAPLELLQVLHTTSSIVDERVLQMREQLGGVDEVTRRVAAHRAKSAAAKAAGAVTGGEK